MKYNSFTKSVSLYGRRHSGINIYIYEVKKGEMDRRVLR